MGKTLLQLFVLVASFFGLWFGLSRIDWKTILHIEEAGQRTEEKLGELYWDFIKTVEKEIEDPQLMNPIDSLLIRICIANEIDREKIKLHIIEKDDINAFALPGDHLVLFTGLMDDCENAEELCGVLAHELAHMEEGHIMKKLIKEIGLSVLISMTTGSGNPEIVQYAVKILSSSAYDRSLEREADLTGTRYLIQAEIDPEPFAAFLFRMSSMEEDLPRQLFWISSHPGSEERAKDILQRIESEDYTTRPAMDSLQWDQVQAALKKEI